MGKVTIVLVLISVMFGVSYADLRCADFSCPRGTTGCKTHIKTNFDKTKLEKTVSCLDENNGVLKDYFLEEPNPYGPHSTYESTSYSNTHTDTYYSSPGLNQPRPSLGGGVYNNNVYNDKYNGLEDFD